MKEKIKIGYIGIGRRGILVLKNCLVHMKDIEIVRISDLSKNRMQEAADLIKENMGTTPILTSIATYLPARIASSAILLLPTQPVIMKIASISGSFITSL